MFERVGMSQQGMARGWSDCRKKMTAHTPHFGANHANHVPSSLAQLAHSGGACDESSGVQRCWRELVFSQCELRCVCPSVPRPTLLVPKGSPVPRNAPVEDWVDEEEAELNEIEEEDQKCHPPI